MREITQVVKHEVDGEEMSFKIKKLNALDGAWLSKFALEKLLPLFNDAEMLLAVPKSGDDVQKVTEIRFEEAIKTIPTALAKISKEDLAVFMRLCLENVEALLDAGWRTVMVDDEFMVPEVEYDTMTALILCYDLVSFNLSGFFGEGRLISLLKRLHT